MPTKGTINFQHRKGLFSIAPPLGADDGIDPDFDDYEGMLQFVQSLPRRGGRLVPADIWSSPYTGAEEHQAIVRGHGRRYESWASPAIKHHLDHPLTSLSLDEEIQKLVKVI